MKKALLEGVIILAYCIAIMGAVLFDMSLFLLGAVIAQQVEIIDLKSKLQ